MNRSILMALSLCGLMMLCGCSANKQELDKDYYLNAKAKEIEIADESHNISKESKVKEIKSQEMKETQINKMESQPQSETESETNLSSTQENNTVDNTQDEYNQIPQVPQITDDQPSQAQIAKANQLIRGLQIQLGRQPMLSEMQNKLQTEMGISSRKARQIIDTVGLY